MKTVTGTRVMTAVRLKNLDMSVYTDGKGHCPSQFGLITVIKSTNGPGYFAEIGQGDILDKTFTYGFTPALAYVALIELLERDTDMSAMAKVLNFPEMPETVRPAMAA